MKTIENTKLNFGLSRCKIYDVFIEKNNVENYVGQILFEREDKFWKINFLLNQKDKTLIVKHFSLKRGTSGLVALIPFSEKDLNIKVLIETRIMEFFENTGKVKLERNYNFA
jgi:hypothetical protein